MSVDGPARPPDPPPPPPPAEPPRDGAGDHMDPILAANAAALREDSARMRAQGDMEGAAQSDAAAARYEAMITPGYRAEAGSGSGSSAADGEAGAKAMAEWEAKMDPILAEKAAEMREDSARMRAQGNEEGAAQSDAAAARAEALIDPDYQASSDAAPAGEPPPAEPPSDGAGDHMDPVLAFNAAEIRREAGLLRSQGNEEGARECEAAAARYEAMISPGYFNGRGR